MMLRYFFEGGPLFMGMLTMVLLVILVLTVVDGIPLITGKSEGSERHLMKLGFIKSLGLFALVLGMLGQFLGLFKSFEVIGSGMNISPAIMANGVKISVLSSIYGMIIFLVAYLLWFILMTLIARKI